MDLYIGYIFMPIGNSRWPPSADLLLTKDLMGKNQKFFHLKLVSQFKGNIERMVHE